MTGLHAGKISHGLLLALALCLGGCQLLGIGSDDPMNELRDEVRATVSDPDRVTRLLATIDRMDDELAEYAEQFAILMKQKRALFADYDSTRGQFEALLGEGARESQRMQRSLLQVHLEFKSFLDEDEWGAILPVQGRAVAAKMERLVVAALER